MKRYLLTIFSWIATNFVIFGAIIAAASVGLIGGGLLEALIAISTFTILLAPTLFQHKIFSFALNEMKDPKEYKRDINKIENIVYKLMNNSFYNIRIKIAAGNAFPITTNREMFMKNRSALVFSKSFIEQWRNGKFTDDEVEALIARQLGHINFSYQELMLVASQITFWAVLSFLTKFPALLPLAPVTSLLADIALNALLIPYVVITSLAFLTIFPFKFLLELTADRYSVNLTKNPLVLASALKKISVTESPAPVAGSIFSLQNLKDITKSVFLALVFPSRVVTKRIADLEEMAIRAPKNDIPEISTYAATSHALSKLDLEYSQKLGPVLTADNSKIKSAYVAKVNDTIRQSKLPNRLQGLLFERASESKTAKDGTGLTVTKTHAQLKSSSIALNK